MPSRAENEHGFTVAFFGMLPSTDASTRAFCERPLPYLARSAIIGRTFLPSSSRLYAWSQRRGRLRPLWVAVYWYVLVLPRRLVQLVRALDADAIFVQRALLRYTSLPLLEAILWIVAKNLLGRAVVYHCDDALHTIRPRYYGWRFAMCDCVVTGNYEIEAFARRFNKNVQRIDGGVEVSQYPSGPRRGRHEVVLGWVGSVPHLDLAPIASALARVTGARSEVTVEVVSAEPYTSTTLTGHLRWRQWRLDDEFAIFFDFDIGLMPLPDTEYNRGREAYKIKEYMAAGLPVVCSPVGHNLLVVEHGVTGFFASTPEEWVEFILALVRDDDLREKMGAAARRTAEANFTTARFADELATTLWRFGPTSAAMPTG